MTFHTLFEIFSFQHIFLCMAGVILGIIFGSLPGLTATVGVALLLPLTFSLNPIAGMMILVAIYNGAMAGGSISAILLQTPGTPGAAATMLDGYQLTRKGESTKAISIAMLSSMVGGIFSAIALLTLAPILARLALAFGPPEYFWLALFGLTAVASLASKSIIKGLICAALGILLGTVGMDPTSGIPRFTFGVTSLLSGISIVPALIGLFSIPQILDISIKKDQVTVNITNETKARFVKIKELLTLGKTYLISGIVGVLVGILPGAGGDIASWIAYNESKRFSRQSDKYGTGIIEGVAAPECANNAVTGGSLIPLLTLGIPGSVTAAVLLGGLLIHGVIPGHELFSKHINVYYGIVASIILSSLGIGIFAFITPNIWNKILTVPTKIIAPIIVVICVTGSFSINNNPFDVLLMMFVGAIGYFFKRYGFPVAPIVLGLMLGPLAEKSFMQSLALSKGSILFFFLRPISLVIIILIVMSLLSPIILEKIRGNKETQEDKDIVSV